MDRRGYRVADHVAPRADDRDTRAGARLGGGERGVAHGHSRHIGDPVVGAGREPPRGTQKPAQVTGFDEAHANWTPPRRRCPPAPVPMDLDPSPAGRMASEAIRLAE